jgi:hypothetical protein
MKIPLLILQIVFWICILLASIYLGLTLPGGPFNKHVWLSEYKQDFNIFMRIKTGNSSYTCFDICLKHGELKPIPCKDSINQD